MAIFARAAADQDSLPEDGYYPVEYDDTGPFRWTRARFTLRWPRGKRYVELELGRPDATSLTEINHPPPIDPIDLIPGWHRYSIALEPQNLARRSGQKLEFEVDIPVVASDDPRSLGVMVRSVAWHNDRNRHLRIEAVRRNAILNEREYQSGAVAVRSVPPYLRITLEVRCNIANNQPCVYCAWNWMKKEEIGAPASDLSFIKSLDSYLHFAKVVNDCSFGEPPLNPEFAEIVDLIATADRAFSFASNGQTLQRKIRRALLGRNVFLYVSIDSVTSTGYARYRNNGFDRIIANLRSLCREKKSHENLPHVTVSFVVMNSNRNELANFIALMHSVGVDRVKLMALGDEDCMDLDGRVKGRENFVFNYDVEIVPMAELDAVGEEARRIGEAIGLNVYLDWKDFPAHHGSAAGRPLCSEPWKSLYVLNRGILPCCFGRKPLARWTEQENRPIGQFIEETFNGPAFQGIRSSLAAGVFPEYCLSSRNCPIVRNATADGRHSQSRPPTPAGDVGN
jgi:hypothetical protein